MALFRLTPQILFETRDVFVSRALNTLGVFTEGGFKTLVHQDGQIQDRSHSFEPINGYSLGTVPSTYGTPTVQTGSELVRFRVCRLLFISGFGYDSDSIGLTISIRTGNTYQNFVDETPTSQIQPCDSVIYEGKIYASCIPIEVLDYSYLKVSSNINISSFRDALFPTEPTVTSVTISELTPSDRIVGTYLQFIRQATQKIIIGTSPKTDLFISHAVQVNDLFFYLLHETFDLQQYLETEGIVEKIEYDVVFREYNSSDVLLVTNPFRISNPINFYSPITYRYPSVAATTAYVTYSIEAHVSFENGLSFYADSEGTFPDANVFRNPTVAGSVFDDVTLRKTVVNEVITVLPSLEVPKVVYEK